MRENKQPTRQSKLVHEFILLRPSAVVLDVELPRTDRIPASVPSIDRRRSAPSISSVMLVRSGSDAAPASIKI